MNTKVTLVCTTCSYSARRKLMLEPGSRGVHETISEPATCPHGHGALVRKDGQVQSEERRSAAVYTSMLKG